MTGNEMGSLFSLLYNAASQIEMGINNEELSKYLTLAQEDKFKSLYFPNRNPLQEGFETSSLRDDELVELKQSVTIVNGGWIVGSEPNSVIVPLPADYFLNVRENVNILYSGISLNRVNVKPVNEDELTDKMVNPFDRPDRRLVLRLTTKRDESGRDPNGTPQTIRRVTLIGDVNTVISSYNLTYIKQLEDIVVDTRTITNMRNCELNESIHDDIVKLAVRYALGAIGNPKYQIAVNESK